MKILDKTIKAISPQYALKRAQAKAMLEHGERIGFYREGAKPSRARKLANQPLDHPDSPTNTRDRIQVIREVRQLAENGGIVKSLLRKAEIYTVGKLRYIPRTSNEDVNKVYRAYIEDWMEKADITGRHHFRRLCAKGIRSMVGDGDIGFVVRESDDPIDYFGKSSPIRLQTIEADRIGHPGMLDIRWGTPELPALIKRIPALDKGLRDIAGVVVDENGTPVKYRIYRREAGYRGSMYELDAEIEADAFIHLFDADRLDGYRGFSYFDACIDELKDLYEILCYEKIGVKFKSSIGGVIYNEEGLPDEDISLEIDPMTLEPTGELIKKVEPAAIYHFKNNEKFQQFEGNRPSPTFDGFLDTLVRHAALSLNLPFGFIYNWSKITGTAVRLDTAAAEREYQQLQMVGEEKMWGKIIKKVLSKGMQLGHIPYVQDWRQGEWIYPRHITADLGRESKMFIDENHAGLISKAQIAQHRGFDYDNLKTQLEVEADDTIEAAKRLAEKHNIDFQTALTILQLITPNGNLPNNQGDSKADGEDEND